MLLLLDVGESLHYCGHAPREGRLGKSIVAVTGVVSAPSVLGREWYMACLKGLSEVRSHLHLSRLLRWRDRLTLLARSIGLG